MPHGERPALGLTNQLVVRFQNAVSRSAAERLAVSAGLRIIREVQHAGNVFLLAYEGNPFSAIACFIYLNQTIVNLFCP